MKYKNDAYRTREGGSLNAAQNLVAHTCYKFIDEPLLLPFAALRCAGGKVHWHRGMRLWKGPDSELYFVTDPADPSLEASCFVFEHGIRPADLPHATHRA